MSVADPAPWTPAEGKALCGAVVRAFPASVLPEGNALVYDIRHTEPAEIAEACLGKTWRDLDGPTLFFKLRCCASYTDDGFCAVLPAFLYQAVVAHDDFRSEISGVIQQQLEVVNFISQLPEARERNRADLTRLLALLTPAQRWVVREFMLLANHRFKDWYKFWRESENARFWDSVETTDEPSLLGSRT